MTHKTKHDGKPSLEVAHILREHIVDYQQTHCLFPEHYKIVYDRCEMGDGHRKISNLT